MNYDHYTSIHDFLLSHGQQELAGHLDAMWQKYGADIEELDDMKLEEGQTPAETKPRGDGLE